MENKDIGFLGLRSESLSRSELAFIHSTVPESEARKSWRQDFTNPRRHNNKSFCYIVHTLKDVAGRLRQKLFLTKEGIHDRKQAIDLLRDPKRVSEKKVISTSIINQDNRTTWGSVGLILEAPYDNVVAVYRKDVGTPFFDPDRVVEKRKKVPSVKEIIRASTPHQYNEIVLVGTSPKGKVEVTGLWAKVYEDGEPVNEALYQQVQRLANTCGLPFIELTEKIDRYKDEHPQVLRDVAKNTPRSIAINRNGLRYILELNGGKFIIYDEKRRPRDMTREDFEFAYKLVQRELGEEVKREIEGKLEQLPACFDEAEYRKTHPLPEVLTNLSTNDPYAFALNRGEKRYFVDFVKGNYWVMIKQKSQFPRQRRISISGMGDYRKVPDDYDIKQLQMTREDFEYMKKELLKDLGDDNLRLFERIMPEIEKRLSAQDDKVE